MLYDYFGRPIKKKELTREQAAPAMAGVRTVWNDTVAGGLTPQRLTTLLMTAGEGDHHAYLTLAEEMEERDLHYAAELAKRKLAVSSLPITVESASDRDKDKEIADAVRTLLSRSNTRSLLKDLMDAIGKGYAVVEIMWDTSAGDHWRPQLYKWRDPRFFQFDQVTMHELRLRDEQDLLNGIPLAPYKFVRHLPRSKSGIPIRGGIARLAAWAYMCKGYTLKDWMAFAEVFGMPMRLGKYGATAKEDEISILKMAVANLGSDAAAVFPDSMQVELIEAGNKGGSSDFFERLAKYLDDQVSIGILGQVASSQGTPGRLGDDKLQAEVRDDYRDDDAALLAETLNRDLVRAYVDLNYGPQELYPEIHLRAAQPEDTTALVNALEKLVPLGLKVEQSVVRDKLGLPDPDPQAKDEDLLQAPQVGYPPLSAELNRERNTVVQARYTEAQQAIEDLADNAVAKADLAENESAILQAVMSADSFDEVAENLLALYPELDMSGLQTMLERAMVAAEMFGRSGAGNNA